MTRLLDGLTSAQVKDYARAFLSALQYMADHNGLQDELDDTSDVLDDSTEVTVS